MTKTPEKQVEEMTETAQKTMEQSVEKVTQGMESFNAFGQENMDAVVASSKIAAKAAESMGTEIAAYSKKSYEDGLAAAKELTTCKSPTEFFEKQTTFSKNAIEGFVAEAAKLNEMYAAAAKELFSPLSERFTAAVDMAKDQRV